MNKTSAILATLVLSAASLLTPGAFAAADKPNILFIVSDDTG
jgi:ABC-type sugar transport system substrate-binding protein